MSAVVDGADERAPLLQSDGSTSGDAESSNVSHDDHRRQLGFLSVSFLICNRIVGTGIFATPALILQSAGSVGSSLLLWIAGACIAGAGTAVYVEFGTGIPKSGGELNYLSFLFPTPPYLVASAYAAYTITMGWAADNSIIFGQYALHALGVPVNAWNQRAIAFATLTAAAIIHCTSIKWGLRVQNTLGMFKIAVLGAISVAGFAVLTGLISVEGSPAKQNFGHPFEGSRASPNALVTGLYKVIWSFIGYATANAALSEVKDPVRTMKRAAPLAVSGVSVLYLAVNIAFFSAVSKSDMLSGGTTVAAQFFRNVWGPSAEIILSVLIALSAFGTVMSVLFSLARMNQEVARAGLVPFSATMARTSSYGTPIAGIVVHWAACVAIVVAAPPGDAYNMVINVISYPLAIVNAAISGGLTLLYVNKSLARERKWNPPFRAGLPATIFFFIANLFLTFAPLVPPDAGAEPYKELPYWLHAVVGVSVFMIGGLYWVVWYVALPARRGYTLEERKAVLPDGQAVTFFERVPQ
ncbi:high-affinity methionine permease [Exidia glandulosa HHB12029]|uniref:High-affinity methionine permease n=1 Tax=Exidia glandulosa HHB12029 TaxID=1314781 RepID=A0A165MM03_EXIGL|nr:high-affinity methionine permease [Exidia glandulosa HHB12029]